MHGWRRRRMSARSGLGGKGGRREGSAAGSVGGFGCCCGLCRGGLEKGAQMMVGAWSDAVVFALLMCGPFVLFALVVLVLIWLEGGSDE